MSPDLQKCAKKAVEIRKEFPILQQKVYDKPFVFLDSAASAQKPNYVIDAMTTIMRDCYANIHRGLYWMSEKTTEAYERSRQTVAQFLNAKTRHEIIFTRNSTEAINLVAHSYGSLIKPGQTVLISELEHHANLVPWQMLRDRAGIKLEIVPIDDNGDVSLEAYTEKLEKNDVALVAITHMSNVLGTITPAKKLAKLAHLYGARILLDGSQYVVHEKIDVQAIDADFYVFTGHKLYGPTGIGVLWGRQELLEDMPPFMGGGDMIGTVSFERSTWAKVPYKFEAGTPAIVEAIALGSAIKWFNEKDINFISRYDALLEEYGRCKLQEVKGLHIMGNPKHKSGVISFVIDGAHPHDISTLLDKTGVAIRAGHHCAEPLMRRLGVTSTSRASFGIYTLPEEIDTLCDNLKYIQNFLT